MVAEEFGLASQESSALMDNFDDGDEKGRLSFCDFPLSSSVCDWNSSEEVGKNSPSDQDLFAFITSKDFFGDYAKENIIFCGKLIPYKQPKPDNTVSGNPKKSKNDTKKDHNMDVPILATTRVKSSRWYMLAFGLGKFRMGKMELSDIKARQTRKNNSMKKVVLSQSHHVHGGSEMGTVNSDGGKKSGKGGLWRLIRLLGCKALPQNASTIVKSSTGCIPQV